MHISEISKNSRTTFFALIIAWVYSYLAISTTSDAALLTNSGATPLPIIQVRVPIVWFYYFAPVILAVLFFYFHFYLESFWRSVIRLPLFHPEDGRGLDDYVYPWLISTTFIRGGNPKLARNRTLSRLEYGLSLFLGWWIIPLILLFYWARYLVAHEWGGTILHSGLFLLTVCFAFRFYYQAKNAVMAIPDNSESGNIKAPDEKEALRCKPVQIVTGVVSTLILGGMMAYLSLSAIYGLPADICRDMAKTKICRFFIPGTVLLNVAGIKSFADIKEKKLVPKPEKWQELLDEPIALRRYLETQSNLKLSERNLRHLNAEGAFLPASFLDRVTLDHAELQHAVLTLSKLVDVSFHGANLTHVDFQHARISGTKFDNVFADVSRFNHARFITGETGEQTLFNGEYYDAWFEHCDGDSLLFIDANLRETHFKNAKIRYSIFQRVDLAGATFEDADLLANKFYQADFTNAELRTADLSDCTFEECKFISTIIKGTTFEDAKFINSLFDFSEAISAGTQSNAMRNVVDSFNGFGVEFRNSHINNTHFTNTDLRFAQFKAVSFINTRFSDTDLSDATFIDTDLSGVEFERVDFSGADLKNVTGLTATHLENMCGNKETKLPKGFEGLQPCIMLNHP
jgi:uncharacterized protein YjbI with pentapeptide repeats